MNQPLLPVTANSATQPNFCRECGHPKRHNLGSSKISWKFTDYKIMKFMISYFIIIGLSVSNIVITYGGLIPDKSDIYQYISSGSMIVVSIIVLITATTSKVVFTAEN